MLKKGLVQIYTGDGKGKTTAALGLALRAAGWGNKVAIYQFLKPSSLEIGERTSIKEINLPIKIFPAEIKWDMKNSLDDETTVEKTRKKIQKLCLQIADEAKQKKFDIIILDEIVFCLSKNLAQIEWIKNIIASIDAAVEIILTGRNATDELIEMADLVTEMRIIKHPFEKNINARKGIEF